MTKEYVISWDEDYSVIAPLKKKFLWVNTNYDVCSFRSSRSQMFFKIGVPNNFVIFIGEHLCWSLACAFIKKRLQHSCFPVNIAKCLRTAFFIEHLLCLLL